MNINTQPSETFGTLPQDAEGFRNLQNDSEDFGTFLHHSERTENHTLTVKQVARMFENAGVARSEHSITNWCHRDPNGAARLDGIFDRNERKWFITPQSVERVIQEELARGRPENAPVSIGSFGSLPQQEEATPPRQEATRSSESTDNAEVAKLKQRITELENENFVLKVDNKARDQVVGLIREEMRHQSQDFVSELVKHTKRVGELETEVKEFKRLELPRQNTTPPPENARNAEFKPMSEEQKEPVTVRVRSLDYEPT